MELLAFALEDAKVHLDGIGIVKPGVERSRIQVNESQIFLADTGSFRGMPSLQIASHDVQAVHSLTTEKLSESVQIFLTSRGLTEQQARSMMVRAKIGELLVGLNESLVTSLSEYIIQMAEPKHIHA